MTSIHLSSYNRANRARVPSPAPQKVLSTRKDSFSSQSSTPTANKHTAATTTTIQPLNPIYPVINRQSSITRYNQSSVLPSNEYEIYSYQRNNHPTTTTTTSSFTTSYISTSSRLNTTPTALKTGYLDNYRQTHNSSSLSSTMSKSKPTAQQVILPSRTSMYSTSTLSAKNLENNLNSLNLNGRNEINSGSRKNSTDGSYVDTNDSKSNLTIAKGAHTQYYLISNNNSNSTTTSNLSQLNGAMISEGSSYEKEFLNQRGFVGLKNLGNTVEYILSDAYVKDINTTLSTMKGSLFKSYAMLIKRMWKGGEMAINPQDFRLQLIRYSPNFSGYAQQDAEEFLTYLIKGLHEDVNLVKTKPAPYIIDEKTWDRMNDSERSEAHWTWNFRSEKSKISDMFVGQLKSTLMCTKCDYRSPTFELFWDLAVPIPTKNPSIKLDDCIKLFMAEEILDGDNKPVCSNCKEKRRCAKRYSIERLPKILVIHLKRFLKARYNNKINLNVDYPIEGLDMSKYLSCNVDPASSSSRNNSSFTNCVYDLYGISLHSGTESSGHYVAYCKNPFNKKWYCFNDNMVREISYNVLQDSNAYILFYQLRS